MKKVDEYVEMYIDEMKRTKNGIQNKISEFKTKKNRILCVQETQENRYELLSLCEHYDTCMNILYRVKKMYSDMINIAENDELEEDDFKKRIKEIQRVHGEVTKECEKKTIRRLELKFIPDFHQAQTIVNL